MRVGHQLAACVQADTSSDQRISIEELLLGYLCNYLGCRGGKAEAFCDTGVPGSIASAPRASAG